MYILLCLAVTLTVGRNILSKYISRHPFGSREFFLSQGLMFSTGILCLTPYCLYRFENIPSGILPYASVYSLMLIASQWCYTAALRYGSTSICATVYSFGFIIPTLAGAIFWQEQLTFRMILGLLLTIPAILLSVKKEEQQPRNTNLIFVLPLIIAMLASGGSGILQKLQQQSAYAGQKELFVLLAFILAASLSFLAASLTDSHQTPDKKASASSVRPYICAVLAGVCFSSCNLLNTTLAGLLDSAILFPVLNIGVILLSMAAGCILFREPLRKRELSVILLGILAVLLLTA